MKASASIGGIFGGNKSNIGLGLGNKSKLEHMKDKEMKNKQAFEQNSLIALSSSRPDLYNPTSLPYFSSAENENQKAATEAKNKHLQDQSLIKLQRAENKKQEIELRDLLIDKASGQVSISEHEPLLIQFPSTMPF